MNTPMYHTPMYTTFMPYDYHRMEAKCANKRARFWRFASLLLLGLASPKAFGLLNRFAMDLLLTMALITLVGGVSSFACRKLCSGKRCCSSNADKPTACNDKATRQESVAAPPPPTKLVSDEVLLRDVYNRCAAARRCCPRSAPAKKASTAGRDETWASAEEYFVSLALPGVKPDELSLTAQPGFARGGVPPSLTVALPSGGQRTVRLPKDADVEAATSTHEGLGVLQLRVPRVSRAVSIAIQTAGAAPPPAPAAEENVEGTPPGWPANVDYASWQEAAAELAASAPAPPAAGAAPEAPPPLLREVTPNPSNVQYPPEAYEQEDEEDEEAYGEALKEHEARVAAAADAAVEAAAKAEAAPLEGVPEGEDTEEEEEWEAVKPPSHPTSLR